MTTSKKSAAQEKVWRLEREALDRIYRRQRVMLRYVGAGFIVKANRWANIGDAAYYLGHVEWNVVKETLRAKPDLVTTTGRSRATAALAALTGVALPTARRYLDGAMRGAYGRRILDKAAIDLGWPELAARPLHSVEPWR
jgi:hypothetical protein